MVNGDFAAGLAGWDVTTNVGIEEDNVHSVPFAAQLGIAPTTNDPAVLAQTIEGLDPDCWYYFDFHIGGSSNQFVTAAVLFDATVVSSVTIPAVTRSPYSYYRLVVPCPPEGADVTVEFTKPGTGIILVDDVALRAAGPCP